MADTLLRIEHHLTKTLDALRCDIGTVREEVCGLKEGLKRKKKGMYIVHEPQLFLIYMQSTSDAPLSPKTENGQLLYHCLCVDT